MPIGSTSEALAALGATQEELSEAQLSELMHDGFCMFQIDDAQWRCWGIDLGRGLIMPEPEPCGCEGDGSEEVAGELVVAGGDAAEVLHRRALRRHGNISEQVIA